MKKLLLIFILPLVFYSMSLFAKENFQLQNITSNQGVIWGMSFINEKEMLLTTRDGKIYLLNIKSKKLQNLKHNLDIYSEGQGGLLDVKISPNFKKDKKVYFTYSKDIDGYGVTALGVAQLVNNKLSKIKDLFVSKSSSSTSVHFGSRITFDEKGYLYFTIGDRGKRDFSQDLSNHAGSVIRLNIDGSAVESNPFVNDKNALNEIYSYGHRNPQGIFYDKTKKNLWLIEHGPRGGDEINLVKKGLNYGWPVISYGKEYWGPMSVGEGTHKDGMQQPKKVYVPSIAPSSLIVYQGDVFKSWKGKLFSGALKLRHLNVLTLNDKNEIDRKSTRLNSSH